MAYEGHFGISSESLRGVELIEVSGQADMSHANTMRERLGEAIDRQENGVLVDLSGLSFMDSTIAGMLFWAQGRMRGLDAPFAVVCPTGPVRRVFELTALDRLINIYENRGDATAAMRG